MVQEGLRSMWSGECRGAGGRENPASAGTARETLPGTDRVTAGHITQLVSKTMLWKVSRRGRVEVSEALGS